MIPTEITPEYRAALACRIIDALRRAIQANGGEYSGALVPNLQSVHDVLCLSNAGLIRQLKTLPQELLPTLTEVSLIGTWWRVDTDARPPQEK